MQLEDACYTHKMPKQLSAYYECKDARIRESKSWTSMRIILYWHCAHLQ